MGLDPGRARQFAEAFGTVDKVLEELESTTAADYDSVVTRADLDLIRVGCWGNVIAIADPALADNGVMCPVLEQTNTLQLRYPDALIVGSAWADCGSSHAEDVIHLPGGLTLHTEGWPTEDSPYHLSGDLPAVLRALDIDPAILPDEDIHLAQDPRSSNWSALGRLALGRSDPWGRSDLEMSAFRVRHTESATALMEEKWLFDF